MSEKNDAFTDDSRSAHPVSGEDQPQNNEAPLDEAIKLADKYKNDFLYLKAEFENYKRNTIKERSDLLKYGSERLVNEVLGVVDNFERALSVKVTQDNISTFTKGVEMTAQELKSMLVRFGVTEVPSEGVAFDPMIHEALSSEPTTAVPEGHIVRVFKKPYKLHDKVIRPGQVIVAKKPTES